MPTKILKDGVIKKAKLSLVELQVNYVSCLNCGKFEEPVAKRVVKCAVLLQFSTLVVSNLIRKKVEKVPNDQAIHLWYLSNLCIKKLYFKKNSTNWRNFSIRFILSADSEESTATPSFQQSTS